MVNDQYRAVMQYSSSKEPQFKEKIATDWYCAKVYQLISLLETGHDHFNFSVAYLILKDVKIVLNAMHLVKKARKVAKAVMK